MKRNPRLRAFKKSTRQRQWVVIFRPIPFKEAKTPSATLTIRMAGCFYRSPITQADWTWSRPACARFGPCSALPVNQSASAASNIKTPDVCKGRLSKHWGNAGRTFYVQHSEWGSAPRWRIWGSFVQQSNRAPAHLCFGVTPVSR